MAQVVHEWPVGAPAGSGSSSVVTSRQRRPCVFRGTCQWPPTRPKPAAVVRPSVASATRELTGHDRGHPASQTQRLSEDWVCKPTGEVRPCAQGPGGWPRVVEERCGRVAGVRRGGGLRLAWFKGGSRVVRGWFQGGPGVVRTWFVCGPLSLGSWQGQPWATRVVQKWFMHGSGMVLGWPWSGSPGSRVANGQFGRWAEEEIGATRGSKVVHAWF
eukprot:3890181-Pyramimonas_sp.AAC.1